MNLGTALILFIYLRANFNIFRTSPVNATLLVFFIAVAIGYFAFSFVKPEDPLTKWYVGRYFLGYA